MNRYNILWIDDDINNPELRPDRVALCKKECDIICIDNPDTFLDYLENNQNTRENVDCIIIDLSMPTGKKLRKEKTKRGMSTGMILLEKVRNSRFKNTLVIVYTITENIEVKEYCRSAKIPYWNKMDFLSNEFATEIINLINSNSNCR